MSFARAVSTVAGLTMVSRVLGFIRDVLAADIVGAGIVNDAFVVALRLPNVFRRLVAEGAFSVTFVPLFAKTDQAEGREAAARFAEEAQAMMLTLLIPLTILFMIFMPQVMLILAPGFEPGTERYDLTVALCRISFPYLIFISIAALQGGVLNAVHRFGPFAFAQVLFNISLISALMLVGPVGDLLSPEHKSQAAGYALVWGEIAAGILQVIWMVGSCRKAGVKLRPRWPRLTPAVKRLFVLIGPQAIGAGAVQINIYIDTVIASLLPAGAISSLYYAERLYQLPLGVIGIAIGTALLPMLARHVKSGDHVAAKQLESRAIEASLLLAAPAAAALIVAGHPIVMALFAHGRFTIEAAGVTAGALAFYAVGVPAYVLAKTLSTAFYAREDTRTPLKFSLATILLNTALALTFVFGLKMGVIGIAAATGITAWINVGMLAFGLHRRGLLGIDERLKRVLPRIAAAVLTMAGALAVIHLAFEGWWEGGLPQRAIAMSILVGGGLAVYGAAIMGFGVAKPADIRALFKRPPRLTAAAAGGDNPLPSDTAPPSSP